jgi:hypothetical protein
LEVEADPLAGNGLESPDCRPPLFTTLSAQGKDNCETSGFVAGAAPTNNYGVDVHIDTGLLSLGGDAELSIAQSLIVTPLWSALVWVVHAVFVLVEWGFSLELLGGATATQAAAALVREQAGITGPWLPLALACASIAVAYDGLVRRRVAASLGDALSMAVMMAVGLWLIGDPVGTVGALTRFGDEASLGTLAVATGERPAAQGASLGDSLRVLFASAIETPWCYLEFGDVSWCRESAGPRLRVAATKIARDELSESVCSGPPTGCARPSRTIAHVLRQSVRLLQAARTNGQLFLALPADGSARNSINRGDSLLRALCGSADATDCRGSTAAQAEFRTASGTWPRIEGLLLITSGLLGLVLLFLFVSTRLLAAATETLVYLLLAPALVLAPAFGPSGRSLFTRWLSRLLSAVLSKLLFAFLLGLLFTVTAILVGLDALGWWTQWLLLSAFWWTAFLKRRQVLAPFGSGPERASGGGRVGSRLATGVALSGTRLALTRMLARRDESRASAVALDDLTSPSPRTAAVLEAPARTPIDPQVAAMLERDGRVAGGEPATADAVVGHEAQLGRIATARADALADGDRRRAALLAHRHARVTGIAAAERDRQLRREEAGRRSQTVWARGRRTFADAAVDERERFLNSQATLPEARDARGVMHTRNYAALAPLAGHDTSAYEALGPAARRVTRLEIDRQLRGRRARGLERAGLTQPDPPPTVDPASAVPDEFADSPIPPLDARAMANPVLRDMWEVAAGKKQNYGIGRD